MRVILGIDQSLTSTGVCVTQALNDEEYDIMYTGALSTVPTGAEGYADVIARANDIADRLENIVDLYGVNEISIEGLSFGSVGDATRNLAILFGIICSRLNITEPYTVAPTSLKKFATGNGRAGKKEMLDSIINKDYKLHTELCKMTIKAGKYDIADAYWLAMHKLENQ